MTLAEYKLRYRGVPGWRRPLWRPEGFTPPRHDDTRERLGLIEAVYEVIGDDRLTREHIADAIADDWGDCEEEELDRALHDLVRDGEIRIEGDRYVRTGGEM